MPEMRTAEDALKLWDAGEPVPAFEVESEGASQQTLWGLAFDLIRAGGTAMLGEEKTRDLTPRECDVVASIATVAKQKGWARMVASYVNAATSPAITIQKPK
jgi:hypothetical protein